MKLVLAVDAPVPTRGDPGRCADRDSPNALPLFQVAVDRVARAPRRFPIRERVGVIVTSADPLPKPVGYGEEDAMIEVLVEAGVLLDERLVTTERFEIRPGMAGYSIEVEPAPRQ
jgi:hypothetical protein